MKNISKSIIYGLISVTIVFLTVLLSKNLTGNSFSLINIKVAGGDVNER
ncbi:hypothetical protein HZI73_18380 [Vallitalea pronyensis]|uniref:Uncharacterized protein n=1 Tax=Vallitalea pronyensis TaxID=1348613 RepID=A0A8J8MLN5_9FIRM|nr:hypothetical protein [Vallitalea pronyensis]QUI24137.1 hypothetical protein HZI73_18380 [Vallitalea pronyensis]